MSVSQTLYMKEAGDSSAVSINDVNQGWLGDCFVCAPIASLALARPDYIQDMIHDNGNGTQSVRLYLDVSLSSRFTIAADHSSWITVRDSDLGRGMNTNNGGQLIVNGIQEIWPQVIENAIAQVAGGYEILNYGGFSAPIMYQLTGIWPKENIITPGWSTTQYQPTTDELKGDLASQKMVNFFTGSPISYGLVGNHVYSLTSVDTMNGVDYAHFRNPWGYGDPAPIPVSDLTHAFFGMDVGGVPLLPTNSLPTPKTPTVSTITGIRGGNVSLGGISEANTKIVVTDNAGGSTSIIGTATSSGTGSWQVVGSIPINTSTVNKFTISSENSAGVQSPTSAVLYLASTGNDTFTAVAGVSEVFSIMSFRGTDVINGFQTSSMVGLTHDTINLSGRGVTSFNQVRTMMSGSSSTTLNIGSGKTILLNDVTPTSLTAADFRYS